MWRMENKKKELEEMLAEQKKPLSLTDEEGLPIKSYIDPYTKFKDRFFFLKGVPIPHYGEHPTKRDIALILVCIGTVLVLCLIWIYFKWGYI